jgi:BirA family biotin operon repressor/biotin-[acetyl-CoA-carboxylase] ligase
MVPFDFHALRLRLDERAFVEQAAAVVLPSVDSTSDYLRAHWPDQAAAGASWSICVAQTQTAGRGRHGHHWRSEPGSGLWFSCAVPVVPCTAEAVPPLSLVVASELIRVLNAVGFEIRLKWPNDLWCRGSKVGGLLVEQMGVGAARYWLIGIGINWLAPAHLPQDKTGVVPSVTGLFENGELSSIDREALAEQLIMVAIHAARHPETWSESMRRANQWNALLGRRVQLWHASEAGETGLAGDIKLNGELGFVSDAGDSRSIGGSTSVRLVQDEGC